MGTTWLVAADHARAIWFHSEICGDLGVFCWMRASIWNGP